MLEGDFTVTCSQCGGDDFEEAYPVPADTYRLYGAPGRAAREVAAIAYVCLRCGHLEKFIDLPQPGPSGADAQAPGDHLDARR